jgi:hypothetical protein|tara:strand:- start:180 stop:314 length:135 start_codon:yes stop_codon:yes gene_type:complete
MEAKKCIKCHQIYNAKVIGMVFKSARTKICSFCKPYKVKGECNG